MNIENIKSALLTLLVLIGIFFTWNIWTYQPNYDSLPDSPLLESSPISQETKEVHEVIRPFQIILHENKKHYGSYHDSSIKSVWKELRRWQFETTFDITNQFSDKEFYQWIHGEDGNNKIEIVFSDEIPIKVLQTIFNWKTEETFYQSFDRIVLPEAEKQGNQKIYFASYENQTVFEVTVGNQMALETVANIFEDKENYEPYFSYKVNSRKVFFLPANSLTFYKKQFLTETISGEKFKQALFNNPLYVRQEVGFSRNIYTDATRLLEIYPKQNELTFVNQGSEPTVSLEGGDAILHSINYLNNHGGWTDNYKFFHINGNQEVTFNLNVDSLPVFESKEQPYHPTTIRQRWGSVEISNYHRPTYKLGNNAFETSQSSLPTGEKLIEYLKNNEYNLGEIKSIFPAYELTSTDQQVVVVTPVWCLETEMSNFITIGSKSSDQGGKEIGLE
ncbi:YycH family regulatory protein [Metabacillus arenae]|uniref:Regulatory protein YycH domain-containing protein n=1 Tax=Metabacillus arenae TaxID=2771434 RepID=A0A926RWQ9_9BACI|nr:two-component system activity regulator YycH [Metabacillus arenae]MBD1379835.1 hypothetical protein [Metabacillus arenae]